MFRNHKDFTLNILGPDQLHSSFKRFFLKELIVKIEEFISESERVSPPEVTEISNEYNK